MVGGGELNPRNIYIGRGRDTQPENVLAALPIGKIQINDNFENLPSLLHHSSCWVGGGDEKLHLVLIARGLFFTPAKVAPRAKWTNDFLWGLGVR